MGRNKTETIEIPDKVYFKIGEVCRLTGVKPHTLRYWESEFGTIKPQRVGSMQRMYRRVDVENILLIKKMLHEDGLTLAGAKKSLARKPKDDMKGALPKTVVSMVQEIKRQLLVIKELIS